jgi:hypothetical protein
VCQLHGGCVILNLMWCVKTFSSVLKKSASPLTVRSLMIFRIASAVYCRHNKKHLDTFSAHIAVIFNAKSRRRYINHKTFYRLGARMISVHMQFHLTFVVFVRGLSSSELGKALCITQVTNCIEFGL